MLQKLRFVLIGLGAFPSLWSVRSLPAQVSLQVSSVDYQGVFDSSARCPGGTNDPDALVVASAELVPISVVSQAIVSNGICTSRGTAQAFGTFYQLSDGTLQITGSSSVSTNAAVLLGEPAPDGSFATADAGANLTVEIGLDISRWSRLSFAGTMTIGAVTAVGSPEFSSANLLQSWELQDPYRRQIVARSLELGSDDKESHLQDIHYSTVLAGPGTYTLVLRIRGVAGGEIREPGITGWTCAGTFGLAVSALETCVADWDQNGVLDSRDFFEFMNAFFLEAADFNEDAMVDSRDLFDFLWAFMQGCE